MTITEFLLARISEDEIDLAGERDLEAGAPFPHYPLREVGPRMINLDGEDVTTEYDLWFSDLPPTVEAARWSAECEAKQRIVELHGPDGADLETLPDGCLVCVTVDGTPENFPCPTIRALAAIYADDPDFDQAWRP